MLSVMLVNQRDVGLIFQILFEIILAGLSYFPPTCELRD